VESGVISARDPILRSNVLFPLVERRVQLTDQFRMSRCQIMSLARILGHIEEIEIVPILEELPASGSYCPLLVGTLDPPKELPLDDWRGRNLKQPSAPIPRSRPRCLTPELSRELSSVGGREATAQKPNADQETQRVPHSARQLHPQR
jgi:hypothetical protein